MIEPDSRAPIAPLRLPKGGGAIEGIGETFRSSPASGTASLSIPVATPDARGVRLDLSIDYSSGGSQGPFGLGFGVSVPHIARRTEKRLPDYSDADEFVLSDAEYLVPALVRQSDGAWTPEELDSADGRHRIRRFRTRTEGSFVRVERWTRHDDGDVHWRTVTADHVTSVYGESSAARITDPDDRRRVFRWSIEHSEDALGNRVRYSYRSEDDRGVADTVEEQGRAHHTQTYLRAIEYGNHLDADGRARWAFSVVFDYGDHDLDDLDSLGTEPTGVWPVRLDSFSDYKAGFEVRTHRLCRNLLVFHHFPDELGAHDVLVRSLALRYSESPVVTLLAEVQPTAYARGPEGWERQTGPGLTLDYTSFDPRGHTFETMQIDGDRPVPLALDDDGFRLLDLHGDGIAGLLHDSGGTSRYHRARGGGVYDRGCALGGYPIEQHEPTPTYDVTGGISTLVSVRSGGRSGFYRYAPEIGWTGYRDFPSIPTDGDDDAYERTDVTGNGAADLLLFDAEQVRVYPSRRLAGHGPPFTAPAGPRLPVHAEHGDEQKVLLVDMTGDGLSDRVRVRNGEVVYWPNLGYGRFGAPVTMADAPHLDERLAADRLHLADIDGSGTADLVYVTASEARVHFNQSGNRFSEPVHIELPQRFHHLASVHLGDVAGNGTSALVLTAGTDALRHSYYDFSAGTKPYLLEGIDNHRGAVTRIRYAPSTRFSLADRRAGRPWINRLPFPVHVVEATENVDLLAHTKTVTRYSYHHGAYDFREREFAGFGLVERWETEGFEQFGDEPLADAVPFELVDSSLRGPPIRTRTWYHTGLHERDGVLSRQYAHEYYRGDPSAPEIGDSELERPVDPSAIESAHRALRGRVLREEVYGRDGDATRDAHPYQVTETAYRLRFVQPERDGHRPVFLPLRRERFVATYERDPDEPREVHVFHLAHDAFGHPTREATVAYGRRDRAGAEHVDQTRTQGVYTLRTFVHLEDEHRLGLPYETMEFELAGLGADGARYRTWQEMADRYPAPERDAVDPHEPLPAPGARLRTWRRNVYWSESGDRALPFGEASARGLRHHTETAVHPVADVDLLSTETGGSDLRALLLSDAPDGGRFLERTAPASGRSYYVDPGVIVEYGRDVFHQPVRSTDQLGGVTTLAYDRYGLNVVERVERLDARVALRQQVTPDYRTMLPATVVDVNENVTELRYDPFGNVRLTSRYGREGPHRRGDRPLDEHVGPTDWSVSAILEDPSSFLQGATSCSFADLSAWDAEGQPLRAIEVHRHRHQSDLAPGASGELQIRLEHSDGLGRVLQTKTWVERGPAWTFDGGAPRELDSDDRWLCSGRRVHNDKGSVVKEYEPFHTVGPAYEPERLLTEHGVTAVRHYDALGRLVGADLPKGYVNRTEYSAWSVREYDANDTIAESPYQSAHDGNLPADEQDALDKAMAHVDTPMVQVLDVWGRPILDRQHLAPDHVLTTYRELDVAGNVISVQGPRSFGSARHDFRTTLDMCGRPVRQIGADRGSHRTLLNAAGSEIHRSSGRGFARATHYDRLSRPIAVWVTGNGLRHQVESIEYGETVVDAADNNLRGRVHVHDDEAGRRVIERYDLAGLEAIGARRLRRDYRDLADWSGAEVLEAESWRTTRRFDALERPVEVTHPDGRRIDYDHHRSGRLRSMSTVEPGRPPVPVVTAVDYNGRGQRIRVHYGNGVATRHTYDPLTFEVTRIVSTRESDGRTLQDRRYVYDPAGNVTRIDDRSNRVLFADNQVVLPRVDYTYDAAYRLTTARGREHRGLHDPAAAIAPAARRFLPQPATTSDATELQNYTRSYTYDDAGNLRTIAHVAADRRFTRRLVVAETSNRAQVDSDPAPDHDENGNLVRLDHLRAMRWNSSDRLVSVDLIQRTGAADDSEHYAYDAGGTRVRKVTERLVGGRTVIEETIYLGGCDVHRTRTAGPVENATIRESFTTLQVTDGDTRFAGVLRWTTPPTGQSFDRQTRYQLGDQLGSAALELDEGGRVITYEEYFPYGGSAVIAGRSQVDVARKRYRFAGRERDATTHLDYYGARYYAPWMCRWISPDPAGAVDGANLYAFVRGNPVRHVDRDGTVAVDLNNAGLVRGRVAFFEALAAPTAPRPPPTPQRLAADTEVAGLRRGLVAERRAAIEARQAERAPGDERARVATPAQAGPGIALPLGAGGPAERGADTARGPEPPTRSPARSRARSLPDLSGRADAAPDGDAGNAAGQVQPAPAPPPPGAEEAEDGDTTTLKGISSDRNVLVLVAAAILVALVLLEQREKRRLLKPAFDRSTLRPIDDAAAVADIGESDGGVAPAAGTVEVDGVRAETGRPGPDDEREDAEVGQEATDVDEDIAERRRANTI